MSEKGGVLFTVGRGEAHFSKTGATPNNLLTSNLRYRPTAHPPQDLRKPGSLRAMLSQFETSWAIWKG